MLLEKKSNNDDEQRNVSAAFLLKPNSPRRPCRPRRADAWPRSSSSSLVVLVSILIIYVYYQAKAKAKAQATAQEESFDEAFELAEYNNRPVEEKQRIERVAQLTANTYDMNFECAEERKRTIAMANRLFREKVAPFKRCDVTMCENVKDIVHHCGHDFCAHCALNTIKVTCKNAENPQAFKFTCPVCRESSHFTESLMKKIMAVACPSHAKVMESTCRHGNKIVLVHTPCDEEGCYDCDCSFLQKIDI